MMRRIVIAKSTCPKIQTLQIGDKLLIHDTDIVEAMNKHFQLILSKRDPYIILPESFIPNCYPSIPNCFELLTQKLSQTEAHNLFKLAKDSSPGEDGVRGTTLKMASKEAKELIVTWIESCLKEGVPEEAKTATIIPIPKKQDPNNASDYRGIVLLSTLYKMTTSIIKNRLTDMIRERLYIRQFGGRSGRSTFDSNLLFQNIKSIAKLSNKELHVLSIDIKKALTVYQ